eukprot:scaffold16140_cov104-Isochrysis_galbana.AAC.2
MLKRFSEYDDVPEVRGLRLWRPDPPAPRRAAGHGRRTRPQGPALLPPLRALGPVRPPLQARCRSCGCRLARAPQSCGALCHPPPPPRSRPTSRALRRCTRRRTISGSARGGRLSKTSRSCGRGSGWAATTDSTWAACAPDARAAAATRSTPAPSAPCPGAHRRPRSGRGRGAAPMASASCLPQPLRRSRRAAGTAAGWAR